MSLLFSPDSGISQTAPRNVLGEKTTPRDFPDVPEQELVGSKLDSNVYSNSIRGKKSNRVTSSARNALVNSPTERKLEPEFSLDR